jgi:multidrug efflux pump
MLTLYTTPVVYLTFDRLRLRMQGKQHANLVQGAGPAPSAAV